MNIEYFSILVDETKDISRKEQLCIILRYFDSKDMKIRERAIGVYHMKALDAESLATFIYDEISKLGIDWNNCISQCYDGASVMSGWASGVQARIRERIPHARYVHCHAHRLNLVLVDSMKYLPSVFEFFGTIQSLYSFISTSSVRHEMFVKAQEELGLSVLELERPSAIRWFYYFSAIQKVKLRFEAILIVLDACILEGNVDAYGFKKILSKFEFILILFSVEKILSITNLLSEQLQKQSETIMNAGTLINVAAKRLADLRVIHLFIFFL